MSPGWFIRFCQQQTSFWEAAETGMQLRVLWPWESLKCNREQGITLWMMGNRWFGNHLWTSSKPDGNVSRAALSLLLVILKLVGNMFPLYVFMYMYIYEMQYMGAMFLPCTTPGLWCSRTKLLICYSIFLLSEENSTHYLNKMEAFHLYKASKPKGKQILRPNVTDGRNVIDTWRMLWK